MADSTISQLPTALSVSGVDYFPVDQGGVTKKATLAQLGNGAVFLAPGKTLTVNASLTFNGTDATTFTFPSTSATLARTDAAQSFTGLQTFTNGITTPAQITSTIATGTAPFVVASTTPVANLGAATATTLQTARTIDGVSFDGSANILVVAPATHAAPNKATPVDADEFSIWDSVSGLLNHVTWANIKATAKAYFDPIYAVIAGSASQVFSVGTATSPAHATRLDQLPYSFRNRIVNGDFSVSQVNASSAVTVTAAAALNYVIDQWYAYCTGANVTGQRVAGTGTSQYHYQFTGAASVTAIGFGQRIEQKMSYDLNSQLVMVGVDMSNSLLTTVTWTAYYANTADTFGTLASPTRTQIATGTITVTSSLVRYYIPFTNSASATTGIEIVFTVGAQTSGTWVIGNVQLEPMPAASVVGTPFEVVPYDVQLRRCQRYLPCFNSVSTASSLPSTGVVLVSTTTTRFIIPFPVITRVAVTGLVHSTTPFTMQVLGSNVSATTMALVSIVSNVSAVTDLANSASTAGALAQLYFTSASGQLYFTGAQL